MLPILGGTDTADRFVIAERFGNSPGRAILVDDYPGYKLIINGGPNSNSDVPSFEFFNIGAPAIDFNEQSPLTISSLSGEALAAYNACVARDAVTGGEYSN